MGARHRLCALPPTPVSLGSPPPLSAFAAGLTVFAHLPTTFHPPGLLCRFRAMVWRGFTLPGSRAGVTHQGWPHGPHPTTLGRFVKVAEERAEQRPGQGCLQTNTLSPQNAHYWADGLRLSLRLRLPPWLPRQDPRTDTQRGRTECVRNPAQCTEGQYGSYRGLCPGLVPWAQLPSPPRRGQTTRICRSPATSQGSRSPGPPWAGTGDTRHITHRHSRQEGGEGERKRRGQSEGSGKEKPRTKPTNITS